MAARRGRFPIVGIGASAGGVEALEAFFQGVPSDSGCGFVVVTHLNPERRSLLHEIVARYTTMPVHVAEEGAEIAPNAVYILPADAVLGIARGRLRMRQLSSSRRDRRPIDVFFASLAQDQGECAAGVVLSGGDADGTLGVKAIKEYGGLTLAQTADGTRPQHAQMPNTAIASGLIDIAAPAQEMGARLVQFARSVEGFDGLLAQDQPGGEPAVQAARREICVVLRNQLGHDFFGYKEKTFLRRVQRRMQVNHIDGLQGYVERLRQDPKEVAALFRDLLINVTSFFRDVDAFKILENEVVPKLLEGRGADDTLRIWVPGCATGEEVFSIAILLQERMQGLAATPRVQIFATDIDELALGIARAARYPEALIESVSPERRKRFFTYDDGSYVLAKEVRDLCVFSPHSVIRDPPFSRIDLISCRNLLIYFGSDVQTQVIPTFHYALKPGGYLFLGTSENVSQFGELFTPVDKKQRIFRSRGDRSTAARLPLTAPGIRSAQLAASRSGIGRGMAAGVALRQSVESQVLDRYAPPHVVVNREGDIVFYSLRTGKYLEASAGAPTRQLANVARKGLRLDLRTALREAIEGDRRVERSELVVEAEDERVQRVNLLIEPLTDSPPDQRLFLVVFQDVGPMLTREQASHVPVEADESVVQLERELRETRERLQSLVEEYETALEELKSSNEELVSVNEELQSTNEELEASKEELQSLNEELHTVNGELSGKVDQLDRANADLTNLFESTRVATIFLDHELVIRSFTPAASQIFRIRSGDRGRPLTDLTSRVALPTVADDVRSVFETGEPLERTVEHEPDGAEYLLRLAPYRDIDRKIAGVVLTFIDVTTVRKIEAHQRVLIAELNHRVKNMLMIVISIAELTHKDSIDSAAFKDRLVERVKGMARSYELIARDNWTDAVIGDLVSLQLAPFGVDRTKLIGPPIRLRPKAALSLGMILHELATNAAKYGALSAAGGTVELSWDQADGSDDAAVRLVWRERGGPTLSEPARRGFGLSLIESETSHTLGGRSQIAFGPDGLSAVIEFKATGR